MEFSKELVDNNKLYSFEIQNELVRELLQMKCSNVSSSKASFSIFYAGIYIFTVATLPPDKVVAIEKHKITESLGGNGNGIIVESSSIFLMDNEEAEREWTQGELCTVLHCCYEKVGIYGPIFCFSQRN